MYEKLKVEVEKGRSLLLEGPAVVEVIDGTIVSLGVASNKGDRIGVKALKSLPFKVKEKTALNVTFGIGAKIVELTEEAIPEDWPSVAHGLRDFKRPLTAVILGDVDSGKSTLTTFLANLLVKDNFKVAVVDADVGQSDIGPPTTIGMTFVKEPVLSLADIDYKAAFFVGLTSPAGLLHRSIAGTRMMVDKALAMGAEAVLINTTGWIFGSDARELKTTLTYLIRPDFLVAIQKKEELEHLLRPYENSRIKTVRVTAPKYVRTRSREDRKLLRNMAYQKHLEGGKKIRLKLSEVGIAYSFLGTGWTPNTELVEKIEKILGTKLLYCEETRDMVLMIVSEDFEFDEGTVESLRPLIESKETRITKKSQVQNLLCALLDEGDAFLGLGVIEDIDFSTRELTIFTRVDEDKIASVQFGFIRVNSKGEEEGWSGPWPI